MHPTDRLLRLPSNQPPRSEPPTLQQHPHRQQQQALGSACPGCPPRPPPSRRSLHLHDHGRPRRSRSTRRYNGGTGCGCAPVLEGPLPACLPVCSGQVAPVCGTRAAPQRPTHMAACRPGFVSIAFTGLAFIVMAGDWVSCVLCWFGTCSGGCGGVVCGLHLYARMRACACTCACMCVIGSLPKLATLREPYQCSHLRCPAGRTCRTLHRLAPTSRSPCCSPS